MGPRLGDWATERVVGFEFRIEEVEWPGLYLTREPKAPAPSRAEVDDTRRPIDLPNRHAAAISAMPWLPLPSGTNRTMPTSARGRTWAS